MKKNVIAEGLNGLLQTPTQETTEQAPKAAKTGVNTTRPITYNLNAVLLEKVRYIAFFTHRKNNAVVAEALEQYVKNWEQSNGEIPATL